MARRTDRPEAPTTELFSSEQLGDAGFIPPQAQVRYRCRECQSLTTERPMSTVDRRWITAHCSTCGKRTIADVIEVS